MRALAALLGVALLAAACAPASRWRTESAPRSKEIPLLLQSDDPSEYMSRILPHEIPVIPIRKRLRPCCAFGSELQAKLGPIPVPFYRIPNMLDRETIGPHTYDSGLLKLRLGEEPRLRLNEERNGLVYTCSGGFIDTAHVRDYADWTIFLAASAARSIEEGTTIALGEEGGERRVVLAPLPPERVEEMGLRRLVVGLGQWLAYQMSVYHEIVTWFGWSAVRGFSEKASAFSPEDLYSNLIGIKVAGAMLYRPGHTGSERQFNQNFNVWFHKVLRHLDAVPRDEGFEAVSAVDGLWWDSSRRLPDPHLVQRRHFDTGPRVAPWRVPDDHLTPALRARCRDRKPVAVSNPDGLDDLRYADFARFEVTVPRHWTSDEPWRSLGHVVTQEDFPALIAFVREAARDEFGPRADAPD